MNEDEKLSPRGWYSRGYVPHFDSSHTIQHITYRLADSLPRDAVLRMEGELKSLRADETRRKGLLRQRIDNYLDAGHGACILREPEIASRIVENWLHFDGERYQLLAWVVMPNHCHVLIEPFQNTRLGQIVLSWKSYTARWIKAHLRACGRVVPPKIWQREYWDRAIRNERHFAVVMDYIEMNPVNAGLVHRPEDWLWSSARARTDNQ